MIARIHPSIRTALFAWLIGRAFVLHAWTKRDGLVALYIDGTSIWGGVATLFNGQPVMRHVGFIAVELLVLWGLIEVYKFARRETLPQGAEHATWLVACSPAMAMLAPGSAWTASVSLVFVALGGLVTGRYKISSGALFAAIAFTPEVAVILPGMFTVGWKCRNEDGIRGAWIAAIGLTAFTVVVFYSFFLGDPEYFTDGLHRRSDWESMLTESVMALVLCVSFCIVVLGSYRTSMYRWLPFAPAMLVPLMFAPLDSSIPIALCAGPVVATSLTVVSEDLGFQRVTLMLSTLGLSVLCLT